VFSCAQSQLQDLKEPGLIQGKKHQKNQKRKKKEKKDLKKKSLLTITQNKSIMITKCALQNNNIKECT
jgi:hypothetical protein